MHILFYSMYVQWELLCWKVPNQASDYSMYLLYDLWTGIIGRLGLVRQTGSRYLTLNLGKGRNARSLIGQHVMLTA